MRDYYKLFLLFLIGAFLGDIIETVFCRITEGVWMSRSSVVWGPFSIVWGLGAVVVTLLMYKYRDCSYQFLFTIGALLGGVYEYICSIFTELAFGIVFWDYSHIPFNLNGRINLLFCFFWGAVSVIWLKLLYPSLSNLIEKIPAHYGKSTTWIFAAFMLVNIVISGMALMRYDQRSRGIEAGNVLQLTIDTRFNDTRMRQIYPNALKVK